MTIETNVRETNNNNPIQVLNPRKKSIHIVGKKDGKVKNEIIIDKSAVYSVTGVLLLMATGAITYATLKK